MIIGYARTSTLDQLAGLEGQIRELKEAGAERIYQEQASAAQGSTRPKLMEVLDFLRDGDTLIVTKIDRLARSVYDLNEIIVNLARKGVGVKIIGLGFDTATPVGKLILNVFGSIAQFEREIMLERQREGIAKAQREGKYKGRKATARAQSEKVLELKSIGLKNTEIAEKLGIGIASIYRIFQDARPN